MRRFLKHKLLVSNLLTFTLLDKIETRSFLRFVRVCVFLLDYRFNKEVCSCYCLHVVSRSRSHVNWYLYYWELPLRNNLFLWKKHFFSGLRLPSRRYGYLIHRLYSIYRRLDQPLSWEVSPPIIALKSSLSRGLHVPAWPAAPGASRGAPGGLPGV